MARRAVLLALAALALVAPTAWAAPDQESTFQDDNRLLFDGADTMNQTLDTMQALGADRVRVSVFWRTIAPFPDTDSKPAGFDAGDPNAYPPGAWERYDRLVAAAQARGLGVNLDVTGPAPRWATGDPPADRPDIKETYDPSPSEYGAFFTAVARRYPGVNYWAIWNEPNQPGWLTPQWTQVGDGWVEAAPRIYRALADAAWGALQATGHGQDTILVGETAPKGLVEVRGVTRAIDALRFVRALYCVDAKFVPLNGNDASAAGCPTDAAGVSNFPNDHPALFNATGWAHHPYELFFSPHRLPGHPDWVTIANLSRLTSALTRALRRYGRARPGGLPLYLTEFGYQTNPPDQFGVAWPQQAAYLNESEFRSYINPNVRTLSQFLLNDDGGDIGQTFQSGLETIDGQAKPAMDAYKLPVYLPATRFRGHARLRVWGMVRVAPNGAPQQVLVEYHTPRNPAWRTIATLGAEPGHGYVDARVRFPGAGVMRLRWNDVVSREVSVQRTPRKRSAPKRARRKH